MTSDKIRPHHLDRKAILYVRQSSNHQVLHNRESRALQYAMRDRLTALGWSKIAIIDDDLGRSAAGHVARAGFERMVAEICLGKVGAVAARGGVALRPQQPRLAATAPQRVAVDVATHPRGTPLRKLDLNQPGSAFRARDRGRRQCGRRRYDFHRHEGWEASSQ